MRRLRVDAVFFIIILALLGLANFLNTEKPAVSELENRALEKPPEFTPDAVFSGEYFKSFENYYSDTFIFRDGIVKASRDMRQAFSFMEPDVSIVTAYEELQTPPELQKEERQEHVTGPVERADTAAGTTASQEAGSSGAGQAEAQDGQPESAPVAPDDGDDINVGYWLVVDGKAVQLFKFNRENFDYYASVLNRYKEKLGGGVKLYSMIAPSASEFVKLKKYKGITDSQNEALGYLKSRLDPSILSINVYDSLNRHTDEYIYFRTDHHWTALGAYYGYCAFMEARGEEPVPLEKYDKVELEGFLGSSYSKTLSKSLEKNPDSITVYKPYTKHEFTTYYGKEGQRTEVIDMKYADSKTNKYLVFISSGGGTWGVIKTDVNNGKRIMVMKDSFGNALVPFLLPHYEEIYIVDSRFYSISAAGKDILRFIGDNGINEVLFMNYMENVNWHKFMNGVQKLMGEEEDTD